MKILIVESDCVSAKVLERALVHLGHEVITTTNGEEAWEILQQEPIPVVITAWMVGKLEGPELCRRIRTLSERGYTYTILLTSRESREDRIEAMNTGTDDILNKPLDRVELAQRLSVAERIIHMQEHLEHQTRVLDRQRRSLELTNAQLIQQSKELKITLERLEQLSRIADISRKRFSQLFETIPVACFTFDCNGNIFEWNNKAAEVFGYQPYEAMGQNLEQIFGKKVLKRNVKRAFLNVLKGKSFHGVEWNAGKKALLVSGYPLRGPDGTITGAVATAVDVTEQKQAKAKIAEQLSKLEEAHRALSRANEEIREANEKLEALATTDYLTGIPNHRSFQERLSQFISLGRRGKKFALAMIDVDYFKNFNDEFGHQAGDDVLRAVAQVLSRKVREHDFVARYGGEEFAVIFDDVDENNAYHLAARLCQAVSEIQNQHRNITISIGISVFGERTNTQEALIRAADLALYRAKEEGRNRVVIADSSSVEAA
ncbi:MAG TPA: diguanylate cyclase [Fimbriimonadales bacterium]|nr:diguanylate cyclase [Fimbriimonadales bacterium]